MKILVVEDEPRLSEFVAQALRESEYEVEVAADGDTALERLNHAAFSLIILDIMLPGMDGLEMLKMAREAGNITPVLMLTARGLLKDRLAGLDAGADDYLVKPFEVAELLARVRAILRRAGGEPTVWRHRDLVVDGIARKVTLAEKPVYLSATEHRILELLIRNAGTPVSKEQILKDVWDEPGYRDPNVVEVYIRYIRNKLERFGQQRLIHTVRGAGYMLD